MTLLRSGANTKKFLSDATTMPVIRIFPNLALFLGCAAVVCAMVPAKPPLEINFATKWDRFPAVQARVEVVAVGASYIESSFDPAVFEAETGLKAFNFGLPGVMGHPMEAIAEIVLEAPTPRLKYLLVDITGWPSDLSPRELRYAGWWHRPRLAREAIRWSLRRGDLRGAWQHGLGWLARYVPVARVFPEPAPDQHEFHVARADGFRPMSEATIGVTKRRRAYLEEERPDVPMLLLEDEAVSLAGLRRIAAACEARGVAAIFVRPPDARRFGDERREDYDSLGRVLWYDDPEAYPAFFVRSNRYEEMHLNPESAEVFTRLFARDFLEMTGEPPRGASGA